MSLMVMLEGMAQKVIRRLTEEGKVVTLSRECIAAIDRQLAEALEPIQKEFRQKEKASRAYIAKVESTTAQL